MNSLAPASAEQQDTRIVHARAVHVRTSDGQSPNFQMFVGFCAENEPGNVRDGCISAADQDGQTTSNAWSAHDVDGIVIRDPSGTIIAQDGSDHLTLAAPCVGITAGIDVLVFAGCDKSLTTCHDRFSNTVHYGGFPGLPVRNPFKGAGLDGNLQ